MKFLIETLIDFDLMRASSEHPSNLDLGPCIQILFLHQKKGVQKSIWKLPGPRPLAAAFSPANPK